MRPWPGSPTGSCQFHAKSPPLWTFFRASVQNGKMPSKKRRGRKAPFNSNVLFAYQEADCLTVKIKNDCLPYLCHYTMTKGAFAAKRQKKRGASAPLVFTTLRFFFFSRARALCSIERLAASPAITVASLTDIAQLVRKVHPRG